MHLYGNYDDQHAGNVTFITGQNNGGDARMTISGGSALSGSDGYRTNSDTRVTIGNDIWNFVDDGNDTALLNLKNPEGRPAIYIEGASSSEGDIAVPPGDYITLGHWNGSSFTQRIHMMDNGDWEPEGNNTQNLGSSTHRWKVVYAGTGTINTSDEREKTDILDISENERLAALDIKKVIGKFRFKDNTDKLNIGVGAQTVVSIMASYDLNALDYAFIDYDEDVYGIRYDQLLCFIIAAL